MAILRKRKQREEAPSPPPPKQKKTNRQADLVRSKVQDDPKTVQIKLKLQDSGFGPEAITKFVELPMLSKATSQKLSQFLKPSTMGMKLNPVLKHIAKWNNEDFGKVLKTKMQSLAGLPDDGKYYLPIGGLKNTNGTLTSNKATLTPLGMGQILQNGDGPVETICRDQTTLALIREWTTQIEETFDSATKSNQHRRSWRERSTEKFRHMHQLLVNQYGYSETKAARTLQGSQKTLNEGIFQGASATDMIFDANPELGSRNDKAIRKKVTRDGANVYGTALAFDLTSVVRHQMAIKIAQGNSPGDAAKKASQWAKVQKIGVVTDGDGNDTLPREEQAKYLFNREVGFKTFDASKALYPPLPAAM
jgi:hypothetical protein